MDPISKIGQMGAGQTPAPVKREPEKTPALEGTEAEIAKQQEEQEKQNQKPPVQENLKVEVESILKENIARYREAGLLDQEEMKNIMSIIVPGSNIPDPAKQQWEELVEESRVGSDDTLNELA